MKTEAVAQLRGSEGTGTSLLGKWGRIRTQVAFPDCCSASSIGGERSNGDHREAMKVLEVKGGASAAEGKAPVFLGQLLGARLWARFFKGPPFEDLLPFCFILRKRRLKEMY